jgi:hypothetical protein
LLIVATAAHSRAQTPPSAAPELAAPPLPIVNSADELEDAALIEALRRGGFVLYMRHALQIPPTSDVCDKSNLTEAGEAQARKVGDAVRVLGIPIGAVKSSQPCRAQDTARLLALGKVDVTEELNPLGPRPKDDMSAGRLRLLGKTPQPGTNTILVSHVHGGRDRNDWIQLEIAEIIVYKPDGKNGALPVARIRLEAWENLSRLAVK